MDYQATPAAVRPNDLLGPLVVAAEKYADNYRDDDRHGIVTDVLNAFYAGAKYGHAAERERCIAAVEAVPTHRWVDGSDQYGRPCPAKIVATRADYVAAIRGA